MPDLILGLDIGTQAIKGMIVDQNGQQKASASLERGPSHPNPGWVEMDAEKDWWQAGLHVIRQLLSGADIQASEIAVIGVSGLVPCLCPLDEAGVPVRQAILYSDNRALEELKKVNQSSSLGLTAQAVVPKLLWIANHEPQHFRRVRMILSAHNYFVYRLTGNYSMDPDTATVMGGVYDEEKKQWSKEIIESLGLQFSLWAPVLPATAIAGKITCEAARDTGLQAGTPVITGTGDTFPTIVGCGAVAAGDAMVSLGTTGLLTVANKPLVESAAGPHFNTVAGKASVIWGANILSAGRLVNWYLENFAGIESIVAGRLEKSVFELLEAEASHIAPGAEGLIVLPHWLGRRTPLADANLKGSIMGLTPSHKPAHIYRAILESIVYNIRQGYEEYKNQINRVVVTAGGAKSVLWRQVIADVLGVQLEYHPKGAGALGIAFLAAYAAGLVKDFSEIKDRWLRDPQLVRPIAENSRVYSRLYDVYCAFDRALEQPYAQLVDINRWEEN